MSNKLTMLFNWFPELKKIFNISTPDDFDKFLDIHFEKCVQRMEAEAHHLISDSEEKLSAFLAAALSMPGLSVVREGYSNGRVDLTIKTESLLSAEQRLAEAKIYNGYSYHVQAIEQLFYRYSTGRQPTVYVIEYIKKSGVKEIIARLRKETDEELPQRQEGKTSDHVMKWAYASNHRHSSEELLKVVHINVNLYRMGTRS